MAFLNVSSFMQGVLTLGSAAAVLTAILPPAAIQKGGFLVGNGTQADGRVLHNGKLFIGNTSDPNGVSEVDLPNAAFDFVAANQGPAVYNVSASDTRLFFAPHISTVNLPPGATMVHDIDLKCASNGVAMTVQSPDDSIDGPSLMSFVMQPGDEVTISRCSAQSRFIRK